LEGRPSVLCIRKQRYCVSVMKKRPSANALLFLKALL
jgi:hypothetical protein